MTWFLHRRVDITEFTGRLITRNNSHLRDYDLTMEDVMSKEVVRRAVFAKDPFVTTAYRLNENDNGNFLVKTYSDTETNLNRKCIRCGKSFVTLKNFEHELCDDCVNEMYKTNAVVKNKFKFFRKILKRQADEVIFGIGDETRFDFRFP